MTVQDESGAAGSATSTHGVILTDAAAAKAKSLLEQEGRDDLALRIAVQPGGCAGLRYNLFFDDRSLDGDLTAEFGGVTLTVDRMSAPYVQGASIDFVDTIEKQGFTIDNPNATGSCACGDSFNFSSGFPFWGVASKCRRSAARRNTPARGCAGKVTARSPVSARVGRCRWQV